jgi:hypothetical protein
MIQITRDNDKNSLKVELQGYVIDFFEKNLPFQCIFEDFVTRKEHWRHTLSPGTWVSWNGGSNMFNLKIVDNFNNLIYEKLYDFESMDELHQVFYSFVQLNKNTKGIVIGSHDGGFGHWVKSVREGLTNCLLIEGSINQYLKLIKNYQNLQNCKLINQIVSEDGQDVIWHTGGEGYTDSIEKRTLELFLQNQEIHSEIKKTISINQLIVDENYQDFDWLHTDVEGYDDKLIMSLNYFPKLIIFENMHLKRMGNYENLKMFLHKKNYKILDLGLDSLAIRK